MLLTISWTSLLKLSEVISLSVSWQSDEQRWLHKVHWPFLVHTIAGQIVCVHLLYCSRAAVPVENCVDLDISIRRLYNVHAMVFARPVGFDREDARHSSTLSHHRPYHHTWCSDVQWPKTSMSWSICINIRNMLTLHRYLSVANTTPIWPSTEANVRQQRQSQLHTTTHVPQATIGHLCQA